MSGGIGPRKYRSAASRAACRFLCYRLSSALSCDSSTLVGCGYCAEGTRSLVTWAKTIEAIASIPSIPQDRQNSFLNRPSLHSIWLYSVAELASIGSGCHLGLLIATATLASKEACASITLSLDRLQVAYYTTPPGPSCWCAQRRCTCYTGLGKLGAQRSGHSQNRGRVFSKIMRHSLR